jgi:GDP-4-dehydro-6-deoxy-D-mannose reductase
MRILITGVTGFAGGHLAESLADSAELHGTNRTGVWPGELRHLDTIVKLHPCQLTQPHAVEAMLRRVQPDQIYHLAGYALVAESFRDVDRAWADNLAATRTLYRAIERWGGQPKILFVSSGLVYGHDGPCRTDTPMLPASPYAASKAAADMLSYQVTRHPGLDVIRVRPFNQIGPRQCPSFAIARFARELARIEAGFAPSVLETGDLSACRDLTDVRDMAQAYRAIMACGEPGDVFVAGSGSTVSMETVVSRLVAMIDRPVELRRRPDLHRPADPAVSVADPEELATRTGWQATRTLDQSLADVLAYWREQIRVERAPAIAV